MRYIYYIVAILLGLSAIIGYELRDKHTPQGDIALSINDKVVTTDEFNRLYASQSPHSIRKADFINSLITRELLIQEAQQEGIDKEEAFRRSLQNFYEQSLIKLLVDRKLSSLKVSADDELNRCIGFYNRKLYLTIFSFDTIEEAEKGNYVNGERKAVYYEDLSKDIRDVIVSGKEGEFSKPIKTDGKFVVVRLDKAEKCSDRVLSAEEKDRMRNMLIDEKKEKMMTDWVARLRGKASVKIMIDENN